jgi:hypothetical protein
MSPSGPVYPAELQEMMEFGPPGPRARDNWHKLYRTTNLIDFLGNPFTTVFEFSMGLSINYARTIFSQQKRGGNLVLAGVTLDHLI